MSKRLLTYDTRDVKNGKLNLKKNGTIDPSNFSSSSGCNSGDTVLTGELTYDRESESYTFTPDFTEEELYHSITTGSVQMILARYMESDAVIAYRFFEVNFTYVESDSNSCIAFLEESNNIYSFRLRMQLSCSLIDGSYQSYFLVSKFIRKLEFSINGSAGSYYIKSRIFDSLNQFISDSLNEGEYHAPRSNLLCIVDAYIVCYYTGLVNGTHYVFTSNIITSSDGTAYYYQVEINNNQTPTSSGNCTDINVTKYTITVTEAN